MKKIFLFSFLSFCAVSVSARNLTCLIKVNNDVVFQKTVFPLSEQKVVIGEVADASAFLTQKKNNRYSVEAFLPGPEARIYAEGVLVNPGDNLTATYWGRDSLIDFSCELSP